VESMPLPRVALLLGSRGLFFGFMGADLFGGRFIFGTYIANMELLFFEPLRADFVAREVPVVVVAVRTPVRPDHPAWALLPTPSHGVKGHWLPVHVGPSRGPPRYHGAVRGFRGRGSAPNRVGSIRFGRRDTDSQTSRPKLRSRLYPDLRLWLPLRRRHRGLWRSP